MGGSGVAVGGSDVAVGGSGVAVAVGGGDSVGEGVAVAVAGGSVGGTEVAVSVGVDVAVGIGVLVGGGGTVEASGEVATTWGVAVAAAAIAVGTSVGWGSPHEAPSRMPVAITVRISRLLSSPVRSRHRALSRPPFLAGLRACDSSFMCSLPLIGRISSI